MIKYSVNKTSWYFFLVNKVSFLVFSVNKTSWHFFLDFNLNISFNLGGISYRAFQEIGCWSSFFINNFFW